MIELREDQLIFSFPEVHPQARLRVSLQRTLRIPDDGRSWPLPPGLDRFPLQHVDDFPDRVPPAWLDHGGVMLPMYQAEAMWLSFDSERLAGHAAAWPFAVRIATGKRSAITGEAWVPGLTRTPQDYLVVPEQPWLDGYVVEKGFIRQFVAMPLGKGYTAEEQLTGAAETGGLQIEVRPMKLQAFLKRWPERNRDWMRGPLKYRIMPAPSECCSAPDMGLAPGGRMRQEVYEDPFGFTEWDLDQSARCFVHIANSVAWRDITGSAPPTEPPTARSYSAAGLPWFEYYDADAQALAGAGALKKLKSVAALAQAKGDQALGDGGGVDQVRTVLLAGKADRSTVREGEF